MKKDCLPFLLTTILLVLAPSPARCARVFAQPDTTVEGKSIWDRMMGEQSYKDMSRGVQLMNGGGYDDAAREFGKAAVLSPSDPWPHILLGSALYWSGQVDSAMTEYNTALSLDPHNPHALQLVAIAYAWKGDKDSSLKYLLEAAKYDDTRGDIQMNLGSIYEASGDFQTALQYFRKAVALEKTHPLFHYQLGSLYSRLERDSEAADSLETAIDLYPDYEDAMLELGAVYERMNNKASALSMYRRAIKVKPMDFVARFRYSLLAYGMNKGDDARKMTADAFSLMPRDTGNGLALSISYSGINSRGGGGGQDNPQASGPLDSMRRNLERLPAQDAAKVSVELVYVTQPKLAPVQLEKVNDDELQPPSRMKKALGKKVSKDAAKQSQPQAMSVKRDFVLNGSDPEARRKQINSIIDELNRAATSIPKDADMKMAFSVQTMKRDGGGSQGGQGGGNPGGSGTSPSNDDASVRYNPRAVGNDLGLWVMGTGWLELVSEVLPQLVDSSAHSAPGMEHITAGLGHLILGEPREALDHFSTAIERGEKEMGYMGSAVASVELGDDLKAIDFSEKVLALNPKNRIAEANLKWLKTPSTLGAAPKADN